MCVSTISVAVTEEVWAPPVFRFEDPRFMKIRKGGGRHVRENRSYVDLRREVDF